MHNKNLFRLKSLIADDDGTRVSHYIYDYVYMYYVLYVWSHIVTYNLNAPLHCGAFGWSFPNQIIIPIHQNREEKAYTCFEHVY